MVQLPAKHPFPTKMPRTLLHAMPAKYPHMALDNGRHADGGGLYLNVGGGAGKVANKSWVFLYRMRGVRREMGLGSLTQVDLAEARRLAKEARALVALGEDPMDSRDMTRLSNADLIVARADAKAPVPAVSSLPTFGEYADQIVADMAKSLGEESVRRWKRHLEKDAGPLRAMDLNDIDTDDVVALLRPRWQETPAAADRLRSTIEHVLASAAAHGYRTKPNVAAWRGHLQHILTKRKKLVNGHHPAAPYEEVGGLLLRMRAKPSMIAACGEFCVLTACRPSEAREAVWAEIDFEGALWTVPAERMKSRKAHRVPLSDQAVTLLRTLEGLHPEIVFLSNRTSGRLPRDPTAPRKRKVEPRFLSKMFSTDLMRDHIKAEPYTLHGFRSSFRDWVGEETDWPRELAEMCLSHEVGDEVERAYRRSDALKKRRQIMQQWADYVLGSA